MSSDRIAIFYVFEQISAGNEIAATYRRDRIVDRAALQQAIHQQRPGWTLDQPFYVSEAVFAAERAEYLSRKWFIIGHVSELPAPRDFIVRDLLNESLIILRDEAGTLRGFYNVCRHRGSRICTQDGSASQLICPYHAWSYRLDGRLAGAPAMAADIDKAELGLREVRVAELGGIVLASLAGDPDEIDRMRIEAEPVLDYLGIPGARIAVRRSYPTTGNWKLVLENFLECYHCLPNHPEFCNIMDIASVLARRASPQARRTWDTQLSDWLATEANPAFPVPGRETRDVSDIDTVSSVLRWPIGKGFQTASQDGLPVAPLMGLQDRFDGASMSVRLEPFVYIVGYNDHVRLMHFLPTGPESTDVDITWLVNGNAADHEIDIDRMTWLWDVTTIQDKKIIEENARGVRSSAYSSGPYSELEGMTARFISDYLEEFGRGCRSI